MIEQVACALREANKKIQNANSNPDSFDYHKRLDEIEEEFRQKITSILYRK